MKSLFSDNRNANMLQLFRKSSVISVGTLAAKLDVSERTVRNDIKQLNEELADCAEIMGEQGKYSLRIFNLDLMYIETYSVIMDVRLMFLTLKIMFTKESTEGVEDGQNHA